MFDSNPARGHNVNKHLPQEKRTRYTPDNNKMKFTGFGVGFEPWIGEKARVVVAPFARRHLWCICAAASAGSSA